MIQFVNMDEQEFLSTKLLYKHMPLENALRTLEDKSLWFANPAEWPDPFERRFLEAKYLKGGKEVSFNWINRVYCTCFTQTVVSEAFWNVHVRGGIGIELRFNRERLLMELKKLDERNNSKYKIFIGKVEYMKTNDINKGLRSIPFNPPSKDELNSDMFAARLFLLKRIAFAYENELRIIVVKENKTKEAGIGIQYDCANTDIVRRIVLAPALGDYTYNMLHTLFTDKYGFTSLEQEGRTYNRVLRSQIYAKQKQAVLKID